MRDGSFDALERVVAQYPATYVASIAAERLAERVAEDEGFVAEGEQKVRALQMAQARSKNPVVKSQLKIESAHVIHDELGNDTDARKMYEEVANGSITVLAKLAQKRLAEMEGREVPARP